MNASDPLLLQALATEPHPMLAAHMLAMAEIPVFPVYGCDETGACLCASPSCENAGKHPNARLAPKGLHSATSDEGTVIGWWDDQPDANIGLPTGPVSGLWVLDLDSDSAMEELQRLEAQHGHLPPTWTVRTGKGLHLYWRWPEMVRITNRAKLAPGIDVRGDGGYVIAPPSLHRTGKRYEWDARLRPGHVELASAPSWLLDLAVSRPQATTTTPSRTSSLLSFSSQDQTGPIPEGARNATLARVAGAMRRHGASQIAILAALEAENAQRCVPPLPLSEVEKIARSISRYSPITAYARPSTGPIVMASGARFMEPRHGR